jgi:dTDP-4-amino-4,6-dideoxygalactose transaminase
MFQVLIDFPKQGMTRPEFQKRMAERGIGIGVHYPSIPEPHYYRGQGYVPRTRRWRRGWVAKPSHCRCFPP